DLQYVFDGIAQDMHVVAIDGVAVNSQDGGAEPGRTIPGKDFVLAPAARVEFIVSAPPRAVQLAQLITLGINTGPLGDNDPPRPLATIQLTEDDSSSERDDSARRASGNDRMVPAFKSVNTKSRR